MSPIEIDELVARGHPSDGGVTRFYGLFAATVTDNQDPERKCRVKVEVPEVLTDQTTGWCQPALPYTGDGAGLAAVPPVGTQVWVQWPGGDLSGPPVWSGGTYNGGDAVKGAGPGTFVIVTPGGHRVELSDDDEAITITSSQGPVVTMDRSGLKIENGQGATITLQGPSVDINNGALVVQ